MTSGRAAPGRDLPTGTVTLLFADVEGSTRLLNALGDRYLPVRARSRELMREIAAARRGHEVDWAGDGVFLVFERATDAVAAAAEIQRALAAEPWAPDEAVRLRMGIHTGEPEQDAEGYVGMDVVVSARICSAAHGGQVVVSRTTRELAGDEPLPGASFRPLGSFRLKDVPEPMPLSQLVAPDLADAFPPLTTIGGGTLPTLHHRLVGRRAQVAEIERLLEQPDVRLVTITGPGGTGKSRLALEVASRTATRRPVHLVGLASIADAELVPAAIARSLGVRESPGVPLLTSVADALAGRHALLYLDNLEHLPPATEHVRTLVDSVPDLVVLSTSRAPLRLSGERVLPLDPLSPAEAVELFRELTEARGLRIGDELLPTIRAVCERVDCLPLAIELVAARLAVFSAGQLLDALGGGIALDLEGPVDLPERQRTLRATLDWSYELLTESQQELYAALGVFAGGCSLEDARVVAGDPERFLPDLETLVLGSMVRGDASGGDVRLYLLETVREHALSHLADTGRLEELQRRHAERFLELAFEAEKELAGPHQSAWTARLERQLDNIRAALDWLLANDRAEDALRAIAGLDRFWRSQAHVTETRRRLATGLARAAGVSPRVRGRALLCAAHMAMGQSDWLGATASLEEAIELFRATRSTEDEVMAVTLLSFVTLRLGDPRRAAALADDALDVARALGDDRSSVLALMAVGDVAWVEGDFERAIAHYEEAVTLSRRTEDALVIVNAVYNLGMAAFQGARLDRAREAFEEALARARELDDSPHIAAAQFMLAHLDLRDGRAESAGERASESLRRYADLEDRRSCARCLVLLAAAALEAGAGEDAARLLGAAELERGSDEPDEFELPVLERIVPAIDDAIGHERRRELASDGPASLEGWLDAGLVPLVTRK